jgi:excisionase family DNA binding protein
MNIGRHTTYDRGQNNTIAGGIRGMIRDKIHRLFSSRSRTSTDLTVQEVAEYLHIHVNTIRRWSDKGLIESYRTGPRGDRRYRLEDVEQFLNNYN